MDKKTTFATIDEYIASTAPEVAEKLSAIRAWIREEVPEAREKISWGMPTFYLFGNLIHFFAFKSHIGLYPGAGGVAAFMAELADYHTSKGAIQLPLGRPLPEALIRRVARFRAEENRRLAADKAAKKAAARVGRGGPGPG